ncbi:MAG: zinc metallopeptidase [Anaerolineales bacterium]|nr:zinc metallopeptidase [Anaerolineales bacterium]MCW5838699.1 zinc metallopeptidase [Anaerolineales bacterium]MCW5888827.1 zinc metallopeptidase [Anaerolineales bacterium]
MYFNSGYLIFMLPAFLVMMLAQWYVNSAYNRWSRVPSRSGLTGAQAAEKLAQRGGLNVRVEQVAGRLSDHYDPRSKTLRLSQGVAQSTSVAALAIAAHELGHAVQDQEDYTPLRLRAALVPMVNIGSWLGWILLMIGFALNFTELAWLGVIVFAGGALFALATLPVELNASARARQLLTTAGIITSADEQGGVNNVLNAAALTYVAALFSAVMQLLYYASLVMGMGNRRR